jgi:hypothetical protein
MFNRAEVTPSIVTQYSEQSTVQNSTEFSKIIRFFFTKFSSSFIVDDPSNTRKSAQPIVSYAKSYEVYSVVCINSQQNKSVLLVSSIPSSNWINHNLNLVLTRF